MTKSHLTDWPRSCGLKSRLQTDLCTDAELLPIHCGPNPVPIRLTWRQFRCRCDRSAVSTHVSLGRSSLARQQQNAPGCSGRWTETGLFWIGGCMGVYLWLFFKIKTYIEKINIVTLRHYHMRVLLIFVYLFRQ